MKRPFAIFPWDGPFLPSLQRYICEATENAPGRSVIIVPHNRPRRYLTEIFRTDLTLPRPALLPRIITVSEMIALFREQNTAPLRTAQTLDRVALLYRCVQDVAQAGEEELSHRFANMDMARFFPWGLRLASVLEECLTQQLEARDIPYTEGEVSPPASALLGTLGRIHARYLTLMEEEGWTTPGLDAFSTAQSVSNGSMGIPPQLRTEAGHGGRQVFIAGLAVLSDAENVLLRSLWEDGAHICLHADPAIAQTQGRTESHWACVDHLRWLKDWKAHGVLASAPLGTKPKLCFLAGYDVHSQLLGVQDVLAKPNTAASTAIVLTNASLLMPTLHHLPQNDFNVSMGYPLDRSPFFRLLEALMRLQTTAKGSGEQDTPPEGQSPVWPDSPDAACVATRYYWRSLLHCLRHPYVQMLQTLPEGEEKSLPLRDVLHRMETLLRGGSRFVVPLDLASKAMTDTTPAQRDLLTQILHICITAFAGLKTPDDMANALAGLCELLLRHGGGMWSRYPLDAESLYRLVQHVIPALKGSSLAHTPFPPTALFSLTRQLVQAERVPFEADPIAGLQILGMLETRLLNFERLLIVDATDDALPGFTAQDPLLPDALRSLLGLPDARRRERTAAHTLYRLMAGAKEVHFFWQEGIQRSSLFDGKKSPSRFVEECLWHVEQEKGALLQSGSAPLLSATCPVHAVPRTTRSLPASPTLQAKVHDLLNNGISPTKLDCYLTCPQRFAWEYLYEFRPLEEVNEGDDPAAVGKLIHEVLQKAYAPWLEKDLPQAAITPQALTTLWQEVLEASALREQLPPDRYVMLSMAAPLRLARYLEKQPETTRVLALEKNLLAPFEVDNGEKYMLKGTLDRVDQRLYGSAKRLLVLDYKTGQVRSPARNCWSEEELWRDLQLWAPGCNDSDALLARVHSTFSSVQLHCYIHLCNSTGLGQAADAAWVALRDSGEEVYLLGMEAEEEWREEVLHVRIPQLLTFVLRHLAHAPSFEANPGAHCRFCAYGALCRQ